MAGGGISGVAVGTTAAGAFLLWTGIRNVAITEGLRDLVAGRVPTEGAQVRSAGQAAGLALTQAGAAVSGDLNAGILAAARRQIGKRYVWGTEGPDTFDCSGLVYWALNAAGKKSPRLTAAGYLVWSGASTIARSQMLPGDLVCWGGHIGIAASATTMVEAPNKNNPVREGKIWGAPTPTIRRVKGGTKSTKAAGKGVGQLLGGLV